MEAGNLASGKRKACKQVSNQVNKSSLRPKTMAVVEEVNRRKKHLVDEVQNNNSIEVSRVQDQCIQKKQQVVSKKKGTKRVLCSPGSMSAYLEFLKRKKENTEAIVETDQSLNNVAALNENYNDDALNQNNDVDVLNENDDGVGNESEGDQELEDEFLAQYGREGKVYGS